MKQGDQIQDRYILEESLGKGGMAEVWRALDRNLERPVAIKFLAPSLNTEPEFLVRFFNEAQSVAGLSHPNVVSVLDFGDQDGSPYLVMEYVPRGAVTELTGEPVQPERATEIVRDAARGAGAAHELGIVHRDIKPGNILLCDDGRAVIADFGIALSAFSEKLTATGQVIGSPHYIAPEQAAGKGSGPGSDVYALGVVLYELLTGHPPFNAENATAVAIAHVDQKPEPPSTKVADLDPALDALVVRALAKDPNARFRDGNHLANALEEVVPALRASAAGAVLGIAPAANAETQTVTRHVVEEEASSPEAAPRRGSFAAAAVIVALLVLAAAGAWAIGRDKSPSRPDVASAAEGDDVPKRPRSKPTANEVTYDDNDYIAGETTPTPSPSDEDDEDDEQRSDRDRNGGNGGVVYRGGGGDEPPQEEPTEEPSPTDSPTPNEEETTEPTPEPSHVEEEPPE